MFFFLGVDSRRFVKVQALKRERREGGSRACEQGMRDPALSELLLAMQVMSCHGQVTREEFVWCPLAAQHIVSSASDAPQTTVLR